MPDIHEVFGFEEVTDETFMIYLACGVLVAKAEKMFDKLKPAKTRMECATETVLKHVDRILPGTKTKFTQEQALALIEFIRTGTRIKDLHEW